MRHTAESGMQDVALARQPILDRQRNLVGYELLFRRIGTTAGSAGNGLSATAHVVRNAFAEIGLADVLGRHQGFINADAEFLESEFVTLLPPNSVVLELLEDIEVGPVVVQRCAALKAQGYRIALDDFDGRRTDLAELIALADVIKVDLTLVTSQHLRQLVGSLRRPGLQLLAEKVETEEQFQRCLRLGFDLFQGYHFARPQMLSARRPSHRKLGLLRLLTMITGDATPGELEAEFKHHPDLSVNLLRMVNSAAFGIQGTISTMRHAVIMLGRRRLEAWLQLLVYTAGDSHQALPLLQMASVRGRLLERLAEAQRPWDREYHDLAFLAGIFSLMDVMLGMPMAAIVAEIHAGDELQDALTHRRGEIGRLLTLAERLELNDRAAVDAMLLGMSEEIRSGLVSYQLEAFQWANAVSGAATDSGAGKPAE